HPVVSSIEQAGMAAWRLLSGSAMPRRLRFKIPGPDSLRKNPTVRGKVPTGMRRRDGLNINIGPDHLPSPLRHHVAALTERRMRMKSLLGVLVCLATCATAMAAETAREKEAERL